MLKAGLITKQQAEEQQERIDLKLKYEHYDRYKERLANKKEKQKSD